MLHGAARRPLFPLRSHGTAPAHRQADAEGEDQGCETRDHVVSDDRTRTDVQWLQAMTVPILCAGV